MILTLNLGSSTVKAKLFKIDDFSELQNWKIENLPVEDALKQIFDNIKNPSSVQIVVHRVVHGGEKYKEAVLIDEEVKKDILELVVLAPLHNKINLDGIVIAEQFFAKAKHIAVFDTAFYSSLSREAYLYGLPFAWYQNHKIRRYGFHGTNHKYVLNVVSDYLSKNHLKDSKIITCHIGNGSSITAIKDGKSVDTSMGFTPLEGLVMGERCGDIDPAIIFWMIDRNLIKKEELKNILQKKSGLKGLSEISSDVRVLWQEFQNKNDNAVRALEVFSYRIKKYIASYVGVLGGVDAIVFTGGVGQNAHYIRTWALKNFEFLGLDLDENKNLINSFEISANTSKVKVFVVPANEELQMAMEGELLVNLSGHLDKF